MKCRGFSLLLLLGCAAGMGLPRWASGQTAELPDNPTPMMDAATTGPMTAEAMAGPMFASGTPALMMDGGMPAQGGHRAATDREETWKGLPMDFLHDQKLIWLKFPSQLARGHHWVPVLAVAAGTAGLIYADPHAMPYFRNHQGSWDDFNDTFDAYITTGEVVALPASLLAFGYMRHDSYQVSTALLCADAYADSAIVDLAMKAATRRERPSDVPAGAPFTGTFFNGRISPVKGSSFPSGHSAGAFSVATVVARRYSNHKWVPFAAYGFASLISLSRIPSLAHFPSDVFLGAAVGYTTTRYATLAPR